MFDKKSIQSLPPGTKVWAVFINHYSPSSCRVQEATVHDRPHHHGWEHYSRWVYVDDTFTPGHPEKCYPTRDAACRALLAFMTEQANEYLGACREIISGL